MGIILDNQLKFGDHIKMMFRKLIKTIGLLRKLYNFLPRAALITIYNAFIKPHLDYGDIQHDQAYNMSFHQKNMKKHRHMLQEMLKIFLFLTSSTTFIKIISFHRRSLNGTT